MQDFMTSNQQVCCAHSIVAHLTISGAEPGTLRDAWACCDCGARFSRDLMLPTFQPEASHLHLKLDALRAEVERLRAALRYAPCTCTTFGSASYPPQPTDHYERQWCARCRALGLDGPAAETPEVRNG